MTDPLTLKQRGRLMAKIHEKDTAIELKVRTNLHRRGYRFRKNVVGLPGRPDIVLPKHRATIFVHGCFWHGHQNCRKSRLPTTNYVFWEEKRRANLERDARKITELTSSGWRVAVVWQCALEKPASFLHTIDILEKWITSEESRCEIPDGIETPQNQ